MSVKKYRTILADPPWPYNNKVIYGSSKGNVHSHYEIMSLDDINNFPIASISENDCILFLWCTVPFLNNGFKTLEQWGFKYKTAIFWNKTKSYGMGFWFRGQVEVCLLGVKGKVKAFRSSKVNLISSPVREHSRKPDELYELIETIALEPKIELFARHRRDGWDSWGKEVCSDVEL